MSEVTATFTEEQFIQETQLAAFLGAYKFWVTVQEQGGPIPERALEYGQGVLRGMALLCLQEQGWRSLSPQEVEAYKYCGFKQER